MICVAIALGHAGGVGAAPPVRPERCILPAEKVQFFFDLKGDTLRVLVANLERKCDLLLKNVWRSGYRAEIAVGGYRLFGYESAKLGSGQAETRIWGAGASKRYAQPAGLIRLAPGQVHVFQSDMASVVREIDREGRKNNMPPLPWGEEILVEFSPIVLLMVETDPMTMSHGETMEVGAGRSSPLMIYRLPEKPPG